LKRKINKIMTLLLVFAISFSNQFSGEASTSITTSPVLTAEAATMTDAIGEYVLNIGSEYYRQTSEVSIDRNMTVQLMYVDTTGTVLPITVTSGSSITIEWNVVDDNNIVTNTVFTATGISKNTSGILNYCNLVIQGIGYSNLAVQVTIVDADTGSTTYLDYSWKLVVDLAIDNDNIQADSSIYDGNYGLSYAFSTDKSKNTLLLAGPEVLTDADATNDIYNEYLLMLKKASLIYTYTDTDGNTVALDNYSTETDIEQSSTLRNLLQEKIVWTTSDSTVATVQYGVIKGIGAGRATITATTASEDGLSEQSISITVVVLPSGYLLDSTQTSQSYVTDFTQVIDGNSFTIITNAADATNLVWTVHNKDANGNVIWSSTSSSSADEMDVSIYDTSGAAYFDNVQSGTYYVTARVSSDYAENNTMIDKFSFTVIVPVTIASGPIYMNVGDDFDIVDNSSLPDSSWYSYTSADVGIASVLNGVITAEGYGTTQITLTRLDDSGYEDYFDTTNIDSYVPPTKTITVMVIDSIYLNYSAATMYTGSTLNLIAYTTNNKVVTWTSSNTSVATVASNGTVTALTTGTAVITAKQVISGVIKTATCRITVRQSVSTITLSPSSDSIAVGENLTINATVTPSLNNVSLKWVSSNTAVVAFASTGDLSATVTGIAGGTAVISAINQDNVVVGSCLLTVHDEITGITLSQTTATVSLSDGKFQLFATILPSTAEDQEIIWTSTNSTVATVSKGMVTLRTSGQTSIVATSKSDSSIYAICNVTVLTSVTGITLDQSSLDMYLGETYRLSYVIKPTTASNTAVTWTTSNKAVATIDATGLISAKGVGTAVIIAKTTDGGYVATCTVNVGSLATAVKLDVTKLTLNIDDYYYLDTTLTPANTTQTTISFESDDTSVAVVSRKGKVTGVGVGTTVVFAKTMSGSVAYCTVTVLQPVISIAVDEKAFSIDVGERHELGVTFTPAVVDNSNVTWSSSDTTVATVDKYGFVTGVAGGKAVITCVAQDGGSKDFSIVTVNESVTDIKLSDQFYKLGLNGTYRLTAEVTSTTVSDKSLKWTSSNPSVVSVDSYGRIKGLTLGTATITCMAGDGSGAQDTCEVTVVRQVKSIQLDVTYITLVQGKSYSVTAKVSPDNATYSDPIWTSSVESVAIVDQNGVITALQAGDSVVKATADDSGGAYAVCYVHVIAPVTATNISISESEVVMAPGETKTVAISLVPANTTETYTWSSDNNYVASVNSTTGKITANEIGTANITIMTESGRKGTIKVFVVGLSRTSIELQQYTGLLISLQVDGSGSTNYTIRWDVDNQEIATVTNGYVVGKAVGTTTVYAVVNGRRLSCKVTVVKIK